MLLDPYRAPHVLLGAQMRAWYVFKRKKQYLPSNLLGTFLRALQAQKAIRQEHKFGYCFYCSIVFLKVIV